MIDPPSIRLQKVLAEAGLGSRRACEELINQGRVEVDGEVVRRQGMRVDPATVVIRVDGRRIQPAAGKVVLALNKPAGVVSSMRDDRGRPCVGDYVADRHERLFHVGRLDYDTEGLLLLTNDGELAQRLAHPSHGVAKTYLAEIDAPVPRNLANQLTTGIELADGLARADAFRTRSASASRASVEIVLHEGRNRIVRRMLAEAGRPVHRLVRTQVGPVRLLGLRSGQTRELTPAEVGALLETAGL